ncbi:MAG: short-chain dehydrogenase [Nocardioidaceae bacterium]|nr:short-chain dehydrogenase [Nocardioidaceae bacterium]
MTWTTDDIGDLTGKRAVITGVTGGLGINAAIELAKHGSELIVTARDATKADASVARILEAAPDARVSVVSLDLADLSKVAAAAQTVLDGFDRIDIMINNAGVMVPPERTTVDGFELQIGTNHLGHFAWTAHLWPLLKASDARVVTVSSVAHGLAKTVDLASLTPQGASRRYRRWRSYGESKLANLSFAYELNRRIQLAGLGAVSVAAHPGYAATNLTASGASIGGFSIASRGMHQISQIIGQPAYAGAWPLLRAATDLEIPGGAFVGPASMRQTRGNPVLVSSSKASHDEALAVALWAASEAATHLPFEVS